MAEHGHSPRGPAAPGLSESHSAEGTASCSCPDVQSAAPCPGCCSSPLSCSPASPRASPPSVRWSLKSRGSKASVKLRELKHRKNLSELKPPRFLFPRTLCPRIYFTEQAVASTAAADPQRSAHQGLLPPQNLRVFPQTKRPLKVGREGTKLHHSVCHPLSPAGLRDTPDSSEPLLSEGHWGTGLTSPPEPAHAP